MAQQTHDLDLAGAPSMEGIQLQRGTGKFENVQGCPVLLAKACRAPYGVEVESKFTPRPVFAGGNDPRKWLAVQVEVPPSVATALDTLDGALCALSDSPGTWSSLVVNRDGRYFVKARINVEGPRCSWMRVGDGPLQETQWEALNLALALHNNFRGADLDVALRPAYIWSVSGRRGLSVNVEMFAARPATVRREPIDFFAKP